MYVLPILLHNDIYDLMNNYLFFVNSVKAIKLKYTTGFEISVSGNKLLLL